SVFVARRRSLGGSRRMVGQSHCQGLPMEQLLAHAYLSLPLRLRVVSVPCGGQQTLSSRRSWLDSESPQRSACQSEGAVDARPLVAAALISARTDRRHVYAAHADRGELPRQQVSRIRHGAVGQPIAFGPTVSGAVVNRYLGRILSLAY